MRTDREENMEKKKEVNEELGKVSGGVKPFDGTHCPNCGSTNFKFLGYIADHELVNFRCQDCNYYWEDFG